MVNRFTVNNVTYTAKPFDFGMICDLETMGVSLSDADKKGMSFIRGYFAVCADMDKEDAALEIQNHLVNGGSLDDISNAMAKEMNESDFFRAIAKKHETGTDKNPSTSEADSAIQTEKKRGRKPASAITQE